MSQPRTFHPLDSTEALNEALDQSAQAPVVLFKHSATCPISARANTRLQDLNEDGGPPVYRLVVQNNRSLSDDIADRFGIRHESPQVIVLRGGEPIFDTSHGNVSAKTIRDALSEVSERS